MPEVIDGSVTWMVIAMTLNSNLVKIRIVPKSYIKAPKTSSKLYRVEGFFIITDDSPQNPFTHSHLSF